MYLSLAERIMQLIALPVFNTLEEMEEAKWYPSAGTISY